MNRQDYLLLVRPLLCSVAGVILLDYKTACWFGGVFWVIGLLQYLMEQPEQEA